MREMRRIIQQIDKSLMAIVWWIIGGAGYVHFSTAL
jgi:hypothetical protein